MKIQAILTTTALLASSASAFVPAMSRPAASQQQLDMFSGAGEGTPMEDDPEQEAKLAAAAKAMNMSVDEYKLGIQARVKFENALTEARITTGDEATVSVTRDAHNPPRSLDISITEDGKALGQEAVSKALCDALKTAAVDSAKARQQAQKDMMAWIADVAPGQK